MLTAWRIVKEKHASRAFDGEGAPVQGGRWTSPGSPVIYTAESAALAALEMLVHLGKAAILSRYVLFRCSFDEALTSTVDRSRLPQNWRSYPASSELQLIGDEWLKAGTSAVLEVPSAVIETDANYLLNLRHRDFSRIQIGLAQPFEFDIRLLRP